MAIAVISAGNSGVKAGVSSYTFNHVVAAGTDRFLSVQTSQRDPTLADIGNSAVTFNGDPLSLLIARKGAVNTGGNLGTDIWGMFAPDEVSANVAITIAGTVDHSYSTAQNMTGVKQSITPNITGSNLTIDFDTNDPSTTVVTTVDGCILIDAVYNVTTFGNLTIGAGQTIISAQGAVNGGGDTAAHSYKIVGAAGSHSMFWTTPGAGAGMDAWVQVVVALEPAVSASPSQLMQMNVG